MKDKIKRIRIVHGSALSKTRVGIYREGRSEKVYTPGTCVLEMLSQIATHSAFDRESGYFLTIGARGNFVDFTIWKS